MKKTILMWLLLVTVGTSTTFAKDEETVNQQVMTAFKKEFSEAKDVMWQNNREYIKATFTLNDQVMFAYYTQGGELMAITRNISSDKLPISLISSLKKNYSEYWITDLFEMVAGGNGTYFVTLQNADVEVVLKSDEFGGWELYKRSKRA
jgi:gluconate kinase